MNELKFNYKRTIYVGLAFFLITMFWQTYDNVIAKILIDKYGLSQAVSGIVMALDNMLAIILLPLFGYLSDKTITKFGKRTPYIVVGTIIAAVAFMSLSFIDSKQTKLVTEAGVVAEYNEFYEKLDKHELNTKGDWQVLFNDKVTEQSIKDNFNNTINKMDNELSQFDIRDLSDIYYDHLSLLSREVTKNNKGNIILFLTMLFIVLLSMSIFRSPAVSLMPDVTIKENRSKANAVINLLGSGGAVVALAILKIFGMDNKSYVSYTPAFVATGVVMIISLIIFLIKVKEPKLVEEYNYLVSKYNLEETNEDNEVITKTLSKEERASLILILFSVFFWYMGYNAIISKLSDYAPKMLKMGVFIPLIIAQASAIVAFIPIGILSSKLGRKKVILFGVFTLTLSFTSAYFITPETSMVLYLILALTGISWAAINVNSFPMAVELATGNDVGKYTGYYYAFSMAAQIITPIFSGFLMDSFGRKVLFPYAAIFVSISFVTMLFVKHGDISVERRSFLESFDVED